jgi:2-polyprenyl-3-methyl-5-hydroxy-6-metoxy-1,4-benzoquinol methylase
VDPDPVKTEELSEIIREIRERVRARHPDPATANLPIADLMPLLHARDAAESKVASIGSVNPRPGGPLNSLIQTVKRLVARALDWHVREQIEFNRGVVESMQATIDALDQNNRALLQLAAQQESRIAEIQAEFQKRAETLFAEARAMKDVRAHWKQWRAGWEDKMNRSEIYLLRSISEMNAAFQHRVTVLDTDFRQSMRDQHTNYENALQRAGAEIQQRLWSDLNRIRAEYEQIIHAELRVLRQRTAAAPPSAPSAPAPSTAPDQPHLDWLRFADRFRGPEDKIRALQSLYIERFTGASDILDIGCGRGEFLQAAQAAGIPAHGIDLHPENIALCRAKSLSAEPADLFDYLARQPDASLGGIYCSQVIEHLPPARLPELVQLAAAKLRRGALIAFETPNPECLTIFATHFYIDPTHTRPVPAPLMAFYLEEAGFGRIEVLRLSPASESIPAVNDLSEPLREALFGSMDYAIFANRL